MDVPLMAIAQGGMKALQGVADYQNAKQKAKALKQNAAAKRAEAKDTRVAGYQQGDKQRERGEQFKGSQRAQLGASGVDINSGTAGQIQEDTARLSEYDARVIENNALRQAWGLESDAAMLEYEAKAVKKQAKINAFSSILGIGGSAGQGYQDWQQSKVPESTSFGSTPNADFGNRYMPNRNNV